MKPVGKPDGPRLIGTSCGKAQTHLTLSPKRIPGWLKYSRTLPDSSKPEHHRALRESDDGRRALYLALFPLAVARIQRVILELMKGGILQVDASEWRLAVLDRDGLSGCGKAAAEDLRIWMEHLFGIYHPGRKIPAIKVHEIAQNDTSATLPLNLDALLDVSEDSGDQGS